MFNIRKICCKLFYQPLLDRQTSSVNKNCLNLIIPYSQKALENNENNLEVTKDQGKPDTLYRHIELELKGHDPAVLKSYQYFALTSATLLGIPNGIKLKSKPTHKKRLSLLKSVHIFKKHQAQYEFRTYFLNLLFPRLTGSTADTFLEYIQRNLPEGVAMRVTKVALEELPEHLKTLEK